MSSRSNDEEAGGPRPSKREIVSPSSEGRAKKGRRRVDDSEEQRGNLTPAGVPVVTENDANKVPSRKRSRSSESTVPSSEDLCPVQAYRGIRSRLRSVLHHRLGLPLVWYLSQERAVVSNDPSPPHEKDNEDDGAGEFLPVAPDAGTALEDSCAPKDRQGVPGDHDEEEAPSGDRGEATGGSIPIPTIAASPHGPSPPSKPSSEVGIEGSVGELPIDEADDAMELREAGYSPLMDALEAADADTDLKGADTVLSDSFLVGAVPTEKSITAKLVEGVKDLAAERGMDALHEPQVYSSRSYAAPFGKPDVVLVKTEDGDIRDDDRRSLILLLEVGLHNVTWWKTVHQALLYLEDLINNEANNTVRFSAPALLAVMTIEPTTTEKAKEFKAGMLGVFLVTPKTSAESTTATTNRRRFRVSLLTRYVTSQEPINGGASTPADRQDELSRALGRMLRAAFTLPALNGMGSRIDFEYLGPNCSRIGDKVFRSYDSRFHLSLRRPDVYLNSGVVENVQVVFLKKDSKFADPSTVCDELEWLWKFHGRLLIISVPFYKGRHYAKSLLEYVPLVEKLKALHAAGCVHGDIRCFNIIFSEEDSHFIDYDLGGKINEKGEGPPYPPGYAFNLGDGNRQGRVGMAMRDFHDWSALFYVLFYLHKVKPPQGSDYPIIYRFVDMADELPRRPDTTGSAIQELKEFLAGVKNASAWRIVPSNQLETALEEAGLGFQPLDDKSRKASASATGSPPKRLNG